MERWKRFGFYWQFNRLKAMKFHTIESVNVVNFRHCGIRLCKWSRKNSFCSITKCKTIASAAINDLMFVNVKHFNRMGPIWKIQAFNITEDSIFERWCIDLTFSMSFLSTWRGVNFNTNTNADKCFSEHDSNLCHSPFKQIWKSFCWKKCLMTGKCKPGNSTEITSNAATAASDSVGCSNSSINWK